jgi:enoyl-[acyl-carrier protein] reductase I
MLLKNKRILISGLANKYSIASGIAAAMHREGAELAFTYQNERLLKNLKPIAESYGSSILIESDVSSDESINNSFKELKKALGLLLMDLCTLLGLLQQIN